MNDPTEEEIEAQRLLVARLGRLGFVLPGSLVRRYTRCGNHNCHCYSEPPELHGPYTQWTRTEANKTVSRIWSDEQLSRYQSWSLGLGGKPRFKNASRGLRSLECSDKYGDIQPVLDNGHLVAVRWSKTIISVEP